MLLVNVTPNPYGFTAGMINALAIIVIKSSVLTYVKVFSIFDKYKKRHEGNSAFYTNGPGWLK